MIDGDALRTYGQWGGGPRPTTNMFTTLGGRHGSPPPDPWNHLIFVHHSPCHGADPWQIAQVACIMQQSPVVDEVSARENGSSRTGAPHRCPAQVPCSGALLRCPAQVPCSGALLRCPAQVPCTGALHRCPAQVPCTGALHRCPTQVPYTGALHRCPAQVNIPLLPVSRYLEHKPSLTTCLVQTVIRSRGLLANTDGWSTHLAVSLGFRSKFNEEKKVFDILSLAKILLPLERFKPL